LPILNPIAETPFLPSTCLGLEMVLTITSDPPFFAALAAQVKAKGGRVIVIVSRPDDERASTMQELARCALPYDDVIFLPPVDEAVRVCPHREELGHYGSYLWHKVHIAELAGITHYVGQDPLVRNLFRRFLPGVTFHYPKEFYPRGAFDSAPGSPLPRKEDHPCEVSDRIPSWITYAGAQGIIDTIEVDFSSDPPTYRVVR
jgi:hypothetical protein